MKHKESEMYIKNFTDIQAETVGQGANNTSIRWLIAEKENAPNFYMRLLEIGPDGNTPDHAHTWEHEVYILEGKGLLVSDDGSQPLKPGDAVFVPGDRIHHFESSGDTVMKMLCQIPADK